MSVNGPTPEYLNQLSFLSSFVLGCILNKRNSNLTEVLVYSLSIFFFNKSTLCCILLLVLAHVIQKVWEEEVPNMTVGDTRVHQ